MGQLYRQLVSPRSTPEALIILFTRTELAHRSDCASTPQAVDPLRFGNGVDFGPPGGVFGAIVDAGEAAGQPCGAVHRRALPGERHRRPQLTVVTNALSIALECATDAQMKVAMTGGVVRINTLQAVGRWRSWHQTTTVGTAIVCAITAGDWGGWRTQSVT